MSSRHDTGVDTLPVIIFYKNMLPHTVVDLMLTIQSGDYSEFYSTIAAGSPIRIRRYRLLCDCRKWVGRSPEN